MVAHVYKKPNPKPSPVELLLSSILHRKPVVAYIRAYLYVRYGITATVSHTALKDFRGYRGCSIKVRTTDLHLDMVSNVNGDYMNRYLSYNEIVGDSHRGYLESIITSCLRSPVDPVIYDTIICTLK